jgi:hypothetical protein
MELEEVILKSLSKRPEDRFQTGQEFDDAIGRIADRVGPGWKRSLEPGADLSKMVPNATSAPVMIPATPIGMAIQQPTTAVPVQVAYNPTPPVRPLVKQATGCLNVIVGAIALTSALALAAAYIH